jgi:hypothetical protein
MLGRPYVLGGLAGSVLLFAFTPLGAAAPAGGAHQLRLGQLAGSQGCLPNRRKRRRRPRAADAAKG